jgi:hypothetical protein
MNTKFGDSEYKLGESNINITGIEDTDPEYSKVDHLINAIITTSPSLVNLKLENLILNNITDTMFALEFFKTKSNSSNGYSSNGFSLGNLFKAFSDRNAELKDIPDSKDIANSLKELDTVSSFPVLTTISFNSTTVSFDFLNKIFKKLGHELTILDLSNMTFTEINNKNIFDLLDTLVAFQKITPHIEILKLNCTNITDAQMLYLFLKGANDLKELWYRQSDKPDFSKLKQNNLTPLPNLKKIYFSNVYPYNIGSSTNAYTIPQTTLHSILNQCVALEELYLSNNNLPSYVSKFPNIYIPALTISLSKLTHLYLDNTDISADYLIYLLEKTPNVTVLSLNSSNDGTIITDDYIKQIAPAITKLKLKELHFNINGIDLDTLIDNIIKPIESLTILELPFIKDYNYGTMAFRKYDKVILYDNQTIKNIIDGTGEYSKLTPGQKMAELDKMSEENGNITSQLNELFSENGGGSGGGSEGSSNKTLMIIAIIIGIILFTLVGGYFIFKFI